MPNWVSKNNGAGARELRFRARLWQDAGANPTLDMRIKGWWQRTCPFLDSTRPENHYPRLESIAFASFRSAVLVPERDAVVVGRLLIDTGDLAAPWTLLNSKV